MTAREFKKKFEALKDQHPYKEVGNRDSYSQYNEGWSDALDLAEQLFEEYASKPLLMINPDSPAFVKQMLLYVVFAVFKLIHWQHFRQKAWNGKRRIKLIGIISLRAALIEDYCGQRSKVWFYWKVGKYYV